VVEDNRNSYRSIAKAIGLFGGVKVFEVLINIVRSKIMAIFLGTSGMGVYGLITSTMGFVSSLTGFGLHTSGVRDVSKSVSSGNQAKVNYTVSVLRVLVLGTGLLGFAFLFFFSNRISIWSFGSSDYSWCFKTVAISLFVDQIVIGHTVLMQGTFHYKYLAKSTLIGLVVGLIVTIPLYYYLRVKGIAFVIVIASVTRLLLTSYYSHKIEFERVKLSPPELIRDGGAMLKLGFAIALSGGVTQGSHYLLRSYISNYGNLSDVGLYTAGIAIATSYIGVVLTAMGTDYSPRLASVSDDRVLFSKTINNQIEILITLLVPLIALFIVFIREVVIILYTSDFLPISGMIEWIMLGMFFRALSFCLSYAIVAKAESRVFFINELVTNVYSLVFSIIGYRIASFLGMGIAYTITYLLYSLQVTIVCRKRFAFEMEKHVLVFILISLICVVSVLITTKICGGSTWRYVFGVVETAVLSFIAIKRLDRMVGIKVLIGGLFRKKKCDDKE